MKKIICLSLLFIVINILLVSAQVTNDVPTDIGIANSTDVGFDWQLDDGDIPEFQDTTISFQGNDYDIHDELVLSKISPSIETSLTSSDDDYEDGVFIEVLKDSIKYYYVFDDSINVSTVTYSEPLGFSFLGKTIKITSTSSTGNEFTAYVGSEHFMDVGDSVTVEGKSITLSNVGSGGAVVVDVDGTVETIPALTAETVNGIEIVNDETFYADAKEERSANLVIGNPALATYKDGDAYISEDPNNPDWVWDIKNLNTRTDSATTISQATAGTISVSGPTIGIENDFIINDDSDNPPTIGECISLPNDYTSICFDSLTVTDYLPVTIEYSIEDTAQSGHAQGSTTAKTIYINTLSDDTFELSNGTLTNEIWLQMFSATEVGIFYKDILANPTMQFYGSVDPTIETELLDINYQNTNTGNIIFNMLKDSATNFQIKLDVNGDNINELSDSIDDMIINFGIVSDEFSSLGQTISLEESNELIWSNNLIGIGVKDENHRTRYGIIINNPNLNGASDKVVLDIPSNQVQANIVIEGKDIPEDPVDPVVTEYNISLNEGWNLISIPLKQEDTTIETVLGSNIGKVDSVYAYDAQNSGWKIWVNEESVPNTLTDLDIGIGYWIKTNQTFTLNIIGYEESVPTILPEFNAYTGWNLVGYYGTRNEVINTALRNINEKYSAVWSIFNNGLQSYSGTFRGMDFDEQLKLTHAYWVYMSEEGVIVPTS